MERTRWEVHKIKIFFKPDVCIMKLARIIPRKWGTFGGYRYAHNVSTKNSETTPHEAESSIDSVVPKTAPKVGIQEPAPSLKQGSFAKRIFVGDFDTGLLTYPEVLDKERHETLHDMLKPIEDFFEAKVDSRKIDADAKISPALLEGLKELGLFGLQIPQEYGGLGLNATEFARVGELISDGSVAVTLAAHQSIGLKGLLLYGTEEQKQKYLPKLATGETIAAFCLTEPSSGSDAGSVQTRARLSPDGKHWLLTGSKLWISNGGIADFFTVFARTADDNVTDRSTKRITAFAVERGFGGVSNGKPEDKHGIRGSNTTEVFFDNTPVPVENVIGQVGDGFKVAVNILNSGRFSMGSSCAGAMKKMMEYISDHVINRKQFGKPLKDFGLIQEKLARMTIDTYVMESMAYLTAGMLDSGLYEDCAVEAAMVKVMSSEMVWRGVSEAMQIYGGMGYMKEQPFDVALRDVRILQIFEGTNEILRLFIALMGVQSAGKQLKDLVKKLRNPFMYPSVAISKAFQRTRHTRDAPSLNLNLKSFLHPTLTKEADLLEYSVLRLQYAVEIVLERHGSKIIDQQLDLQRFANVAIDIYAMTAVLSRASRSYCIGIRNAESEITIAAAFCQEAHRRVRQNIEELVDGPNCDEYVSDLAKKVVENKGYFCEHPLTRTFW
ncbi:unnamed protein product [Allacma fusca]|uniref:Acyl-CoA dehydrogenase n=1 Tax=Allacma fusca TaxID=39272 RepID=A0A8J2PRY7_9HEXA|nr:unnamed protein product [Allacma fusca]